MNTTPKLKNAVEAIAAAHGMDLTTQGSHIRLDMPGMNRLCIEVIWRNQISIAHYFESNGDLVADPDVVVLVTPEGWVPMYFQNVYAYSEAIELDDAGNIATVDPQVLASLVEFCQGWGETLDAEGWATRGELERVG